MSIRTGLVSILLLFAAGITLADETASAPEPLPSGIVEHTRRRLIQLDATAIGPEEVLASLTREDFSLVVAGRPIPEFTVDRLCEGKPAPPSTPAETVAATISEVELPPTIAFYFDQQHLSMSGRARAFELARAMIPELVRDGARGLVVSNGDELRTFCDLTSDPDKLLASLDEMDRDRKHWNLKAHEEEQNVREVLDRLNRGEMEQAEQIARQHQQKERWLADKAMGRLSMVLGRLSDLGPPKVLFYFADTMRSNAGDHYLGFFGRAARERAGDVAAMAADSLSGAAAFERVVAQAMLSGVRLYTIQAAGLVTDALTSGFLGTMQAGQSPVPAGRRVTDAQDTLARMAQETGGKAFLNGVAAAKISRAVTEDLSCLFLISFDAAGFPEDASLRVVLDVARPKVRLQVRGSIIVASEQSRMTNRLLAAFSAPDTAQGRGGLRVHLLPTGFVDGRYRALVQIVPEPSRFAGATWDLGFSVVAEGRVRQDAAGRVSVAAIAAPVVFESEISLKPGPYEIVAVAHETRADEVSTLRIEGTLPKPDVAPLTIGETVLLQPAVALFSRSGELRRSGPVAIGSNEAARVDIPTAFVTLLCATRGPRDAAARVERRLVGETTATFESFPLVADRDEPCSVVRDVIPMRTMTAGGFRYEIEVLAGTTRLASSGIDFYVAAPELVVPTPGADGS